MFNRLTCKVRFHVAVWSLSKSIRSASFIENFPRISAKPIAFQRNLLRKLPRNRPFFTNCFSAKLPRNRPFFREFVPENPAKSAPVRSPDILTWLWGFQVKIVIFQMSLSFQKTLEYKENNFKYCMDVWQESLGDRILGSLSTRVYETRTATGR